MAKPSSPIVQVSELFQAGIVVRDLEKSLEQYQDVFGIKSWALFDVDSSMMTDVIYRGREVKGPFRFKAALAMVGPMQLEVFQPIEGDLTFSDFLKEHGEGLHHLGYGKVQNIDESVQALERAGFSCLQRGRLILGGVVSYFAYMDTVKQLGFILELLQSPEGTPPVGR